MTRRSTTRRDITRSSTTRRNARRRWRTAAAAIAVGGTLAVTGALAGCSSSPASAASGQSITRYSGQHEQTTDGLVAAFEKQTGITVNVRNDDEDTLANLIAVQGQHTPADVFLHGKLARS